MKQGSTRLPAIICVFEEIPAENSGDRTVDGLALRFFGDARRLSDVLQSLSLHLGSVLDLAEVLVQCFQRDRDARYFKDSGQSLKYC